MDDDELVALAVQHFADGCSNGTHRLCPYDRSPPCKCNDVAQKLLANVNTRKRAETYDVGREHLSVSKHFPDQRWTVAALVREVDRQCTTPPWATPSDARRTIWLTSALARLGEHGMPPDALLRTGMRRILKVAITSLTVLSLRNRTDSDHDIHEQLTPWVDRLIECETSDNNTFDASREVADLGTAISAAMTGKFSEVFEHWLQVSTIRDICAWRYVAANRPELPDSDLTVRGGNSAIDWFVDRFSHTQLEDWNRTSLDWELRFASNPVVTAREAGIPLSMLQQRPSHQGTVVEAIVARSMSLRWHDSLPGGMTLAELQENTVRFISEGLLLQAIDLLRHVSEELRHISILRNLLGFCLIPVNPSEALQEFGSCNAGDNLPVMLLQLNTIAAQWRRQNLVTARNLLAQIESPTGENQFLLWRPADLNNPDLDARAFQLKNYSSRDWVTESKALLAVA